MNELTLLQKAMRVVEEHEPGLFDVHTNKGRDFIQAMQKVLDTHEQEIKEHQQLEDEAASMLYDNLFDVANTVIWVDEIKKSNL
jgi:hypothetical protein